MPSTGSHGEGNPPETPLCVQVVAVPGKMAYKWRMLTPMLMETPWFSMLLVEFVVSTALVFFLATQLARYADALEKTTAIGALWIGGIFLAIVTSLPEAVASIGSALDQNKELLNLGVANLFGSNAFNLLILILLDLRQKAPLLYSVSRDLLPAGIGGVVMVGVAGAAVAVHHYTGVGDAPRWLGLLFSLILLVVYLVMTWITKPKPLHQKGAGEQGTEPDEACPYSRQQIIGRLVFFAFALVLVAWWLLQICDAMAETPFSILGRSITLGRTVTGTFLLSFATSSPEIFVCFAALRLGQTNMAVANLLGSNMVNMFFLPLMHLASRDWGFYARIDRLSILTLMGVAILMTGLFMVGVLVRSKRDIFRLSWATLSMLVVYVAGAWLVLKLGLQL